MSMPSAPHGPSGAGHAGVPADLIRDTLAAIGGPDHASLAEARERQERLTKPSGSLGMLEDLSVQLAGLAAGGHRSDGG